LAYKNAGQNAVSKTHLPYIAILQDWSSIFAQVYCNSLSRQ